MRNLCWTGVAVLGFGALQAVGGETVPIKDVPTAVMKSVRAKFPGAEVRGAEKETEDGRTVFEVSLKDGGRAVDVSLTPDGTVLEVEKEVAESALPAEVARAVKAAVPGGKVKKAEEVTRGAAVTFEVDVEVNGKTREVVLDRNGKVLPDGD